jgi:hypothetical protein
MKKRLVNEDAMVETTAKDAVVEASDFLASLSEIAS